MPSSGRCGGSIGPTSEITCITMPSVRSFESFGFGSSLPIVGDVFSTVELTVDVDSTGGVAVGGRDGSGEEGEGGGRSLMALRLGSRLEYRFVAQTASTVS